jgi:hypothetical protein
MTKNTPPLAYLVYEAADLPGQWVSHCLNFDLVSQGDSASDAIDSIVDAVNLVLAEATASDYRMAPDYLWDQWASVLEEGEKVDIDDLDDAMKRDGRRAGFTWFVAGFLRVSAEQKPGVRATRAREQRVPSAEAVA